MTDPADFAWILRGFTDVVHACYAAFERSDYLLATFFLTALHDKRQVVQTGDGSEQDFGFRLDVHEPRFDEMGLLRFGLAKYDGGTGHAHFASWITLDGTAIAVWRARMTTSYDRNWIEILPGADGQILDTAGVPADVQASYREHGELRESVIQISGDSPRPSVRELGADLNVGAWLAELPAPEGETLGFDETLWQ